MTLSRRSFLKMAGLTTVAVAGASMFTGCGSLTTPVKYEGTPADVVTELNKSQYTTAYYPLSMLKNETIAKTYMTGFLIGYSKRDKFVIEKTEVKDIEVKDNKETKTVTTLVVTLKAVESNTGAAQ